MTNGYQITYRDHSRRASPYAKFSGECMLAGVFTGQGAQVDTVKCGDLALYSRHCQEFPAQTADGH